MNTDDVDVKRSIVGLSSEDDDENELGMLKVSTHALYAPGCFESLTDVPHLFDFRDSSLRSWTELLGWRTRGRRRRDARTVILYHSE